MGMGAAKDFAVYQPVEVDVGTILGTTGDLVDTVGTNGTLTNDAILTCESTTLESTGASPHFLIFSPASSTARIILS